MPFTPVDSTIGGILIGMSVAGMMMFHGRVSGMSGQLSNFITQLGTPLFTRPERRQPRFQYYIAGLLIAGFLLKFFLSPYEAFNSFNFLKSTIYLLYRPGAASSLEGPVIIFGLSGFCVGLGTSLANGCTSGHMLCGVARGSKRSILSTVIFCTVAFLVVQFTQRSDALFRYYHTDMPPSYFSYTFFYFPSILRTITMIIVVLIIVSAYVAFYMLGKGEMSGHKDDTDRWVLFMYMFNALVFGIGLGYSGMTVPQKVVSFFAIGSTNWDPSLFCVALGGILPNFLLHHAYFKKQILLGNKPLYAKKYDVPTNTAIDMRLIVGSILFGLGWGLSGICPGPAIVGLLYRGELWLYMLGFVAGLKAKRMIFHDEVLVPPKSHIITSHSDMGSSFSSVSSNNPLKFRGRP